MILLLPFPTIAAAAVVVAVGAAAVSAYVADIFVAGGGLLTLTLVGYLYICISKSMYVYICIKVRGLIPSSLKYKS